MNAHGQILTQTGNGTLLGTNEIGQLTIVARPGDSIQVAPAIFARSSRSARFWGATPAAGRLSE